MHPGDKQLPDMDEIITPCQLRDRQLPSSGTDRDMNAHSVGRSGAACEPSFHGHPLGTPPAQRAALLQLRHQQGTAQSCQLSSPPRQQRPLIPAAQHTWIQGHNPGTTVALHLTGRLLRVLPLEHWPT